MVLRAVGLALQQLLLPVSLMSLLAVHGVTPLKCHSSVKGKVILGDTISCDDKANSCHEQYRLVQGAIVLEYHAGCGPYVRDPNDVVPADSIAETKEKECFSNGCNRQLLNELEAAGRRICYAAHRDPSYTRAAAICAKGVKECYLDQMVGASTPAYYAGCGGCPSYTLYCYFCTEKNYCLATPETSKIVVYLDEPVE